MKILLTGSSGFIGQHLTPRLEIEHTVHHLKSDLLEFAAVTEEVAKFKPDVIVHLAARTEVENSFYEQIAFSQINYVGTVNLIEAASKVRDNIIPKRFIAFDENTQPNPNAPYAVAKYGCEKYLEYAHRSLGLPFTAIRQTNSYGRKDNDFFVTEQIITQMLSNPQRIGLGYGEPYRNFIFIDDLLDAWCSVINNPAKVNNGYIFTIGPDNPIKIKDYVSMIADKINWGGEVVWDTKPVRPGEIYWLNSNHRLITSITGWEPKQSLSDGLDYTIAVWQDKLQQHRKKVVSIR